MNQFNEKHVLHELKQYLHSQQALLVLMCCLLMLRAAKLL